MTKLIRDSRLMFGRSLRNTLRNPIWTIIGLFQPALYMLLFAPLLDGMTGGQGNALRSFTPGLLIMMSMFSCVFVGFGLIGDIREGVVERFRVTPVSRLALLLGRIMNDVLILMIQCIILLVIAALMGVQVDIPAAALTLLLVALIGAGMAALSYSLALVTKDENGLASMVNTFTQPVLLLSGVLLPLSFAPAIIKTIANLNPLSHAVDASRALFDSAFSDPSVLLGFGLVLVLTALASLWATRLFRTVTA
jgi:ABC-2 type transport system permease protein